MKLHHRPSILVEVQHYAALRLFTRWPRCLQLQKIHSLLLQAEAVAWNLDGCCLWWLKHVSLHGDMRMCGAGTWQAFPQIMVLNAAETTHRTLARIPRHRLQAPYMKLRIPFERGNWVADMQVLLSEMQRSCSRCKVFASRAAKPACRPTIFTSPPAVFASRVTKPQCRTTIFTSRPDRLLFYYSTISFPFGSRQRFLHLGSRNLNVEPQFSPVGLTVYYLTILLFHFHLVPGRGFCISGHETWMSNDHFHRSAGLSHEFFFASRTTNPACRLTLLHVGQAYPFIRTLCTYTPQRISIKGLRVSIGCFLRFL